MRHRVGYVDTYQVFFPRHGEVLAVELLQACDADVGHIRVGAVADVDGVRDGNGVFHVAELVGVDQVVLVLAHDIDDGIERFVDGKAFFTRLGIFVVTISVTVELVVRD